MSTRLRGGRAAGAPAILLSAGALVACSLILLVSGPSPANAGGKSVACFESTLPQGKKPRFSAEPKRCVFIAAGAVDSPIPPSFAVQQIIKLDWKSWNGRRAVARGRGYTSVRRKPVPVTVTLSKPRRKCGHRAYSKAKFKYQFGIPAEPLNLSTC